MRRYTRVCTTPLRQRTFPGDGNPEGIRAHDEWRPLAEPADPEERGAIPTEQQEISASHCKERQARGDEYLKE
jgi:hypothetical protein